MWDYLLITTTANKVRPHLLNAVKLYHPVIALVITLCPGGPRLIRKSVSFKFTSHQRNQLLPAHFSFLIKDVSSSPHVKCKSLICGAAVHEHQKVL